jgi:ABC-type polysaccharide/polyol phosphate transport system ATPase subunit
VDYSEIGQFIDEPIKNYSSGMMMRLAFALAVQLDPEVLLLDEIFAVGDEGFQQKCRRTMQQFIDDGHTLVFVSHSPALVRDMCNRVCVLSGGRKIFDGGVDEGLALYHAIAATEPQRPFNSDHTGPPHDDRVVTRRPGE